MADDGVAGAWHMSVRRGGMRRTLGSKIALKKFANPLRDGKSSAAWLDASQKVQCQLRRFGWLDSFPPPPPQACVLQVGQQPVLLSPRPMQCPCKIMICNATPRMTSCRMGIVCVVQAIP